MSFIKCACQSCRENIEVESDYLGQAINCPHCGQPTALNPIPPTPGARALNPQFIQAPTLVRKRNRKPFILVGSLILAIAVAIGLLKIFNPEQAEQFVLSLMVVGFGCICLAIYFLPAIMAHSAKRKNAGAILVLNLFLGWSGLGWIISLVWACMEDK